MSNHPVWLGYKQAIAYELKTHGTSQPCKQEKETTIANNSEWVLLSLEYSFCSSSSLKIRATVLGTGRWKQVMNRVPAAQAGRQNSLLFFYKAMNSETNGFINKLFLIAFWCVQKENSNKYVMKTLISHALLLNSGGDFPIYRNMTQYEEEKITRRLNWKQKILELLSVPVLILHSDLFGVHMFCQVSCTWSF